SHEGAVLPRLRRSVGYTQQIGWMHRHKHGLSVRRRKGPPSLPRYRDLTAEHSAGAAAAQKDKQFGAQLNPFDIQPEPADRDLFGIGRLMDAAASARGEFEVLDGVGDVDRAAIDPGLLHRAIQHLAGRAYERPADDILLISRLLAHEHDLRAGRSLPEHRLRRRLEQCAAPAG